MRKSNRAGLVCLQIGVRASEANKLKYLWPDWTRQVRLEVQWKLPCVSTPTRAREEVCTGRGDGHNAHCIKHLRSRAMSGMQKFSGLQRRLAVDTQTGVCVC